MAQQLNYFGEIRSIHSSSTNQNGWGAKLRLVTRLVVVGALFMAALACGNESESQSDTTEAAYDVEYTASWGPAVGSTLPDLTVKSTGGALVSFADLRGAKGLLIFFVRSSDW